MDDKLQPAIRVAVISGSRAGKNYLADELQRFPGIIVAYKGSSLQTNFKSLKNASPDIIFLATGEPNTFYYEIDPDFHKIKKGLPKTKIVIRTELEREHEFVKKAIEAGASIIDERCDPAEIIGAIRRTARGEKVVLYKGEGGDLEHNRLPIRSRR